MCDAVTLAPMRLLTMVMLLLVSAPAFAQEAGTPNDSRVGEHAGVEASGPEGPLEPGDSDVDAAANASDQTDQAADQTADQMGERSDRAIDENALSLDLDALSPALIEPEHDVQSNLESPRVVALSEALALPAFDFDGLSFISATRSLVTGVFETYCAANAFLADDIGAVEVVLGVGCTLGAATLFVLGIRNLVSPRERREGRASFVRFETLRAEAAATGESLDEPTLAVFEQELSEAAARGRRRRIVEIVFGGLNLAAGATLIGLTARDRIERTAGITIASGTIVLGVMGLMAIFARSPADRAFRDYQLRF